MQTKKNVQKIEVLKPTSGMMVNKKGFLPPPVIGVLAVIGIAAGSIGIYNYFTGDSSEDQEELSVVKTQVTMPDGTIKDIERDTEDQAMCGTDKKTSSDFITINPLDDDGTASYPSVTLKLKDTLGTGSLMSYTTDSDGTFAASSLSLTCGKEFDVYAPAVINETASGKFLFKTMDPVNSMDLPIEALDHISVRAYDEINHGNVYDTGDASATDNEDLAAGSVTFTSTTDNTTAYAMGTTSELHMTFTMSTAAQKSWGDLKNYIAVDADADDFAKAPTLIFEDKVLVQVGKGALNEDDQGYLSAYEYVYALPYDIGESSVELEIKAKAKSNQDPDSDIVIRPIAESYWLDGTNIKKSIFKNDGTEVLMTARTITIDIS